ncbi:MAG: efflux RND transporter periplasmic adaptor subunit [Chromatiales bacterium]|nr:efflux RND transporter periplasmic adaptor subunit [Chromatiales bacterium]
MQTDTQRTRLRRPFIVAAVVSLLLSACKFPNSSESPASEKQAAPVPTVGIYEVIPQSVIISSELAGRTAAYLIAEVRPQVSGIIIERPFKEGGDVEAGQTLYQIDPSTYQASYDNALATLARDEAALTTTRLKAKRYAELVTVNAVSQEANDDVAAALKQAQATVAMDKAALESARIDLAHTRVSAPIGGRIGRSTVTQGALVTANQPAALATVRQLDPIYVDVTQSSAQLLRLKRVLSNGEVQPLDALSAKVGLTLEDGSQYGHTGTLEFSEVTVDESTGSVTLRALFPNPQGQLLPGMYVRARVQEGVREQAVLIPQQALNRDNQGKASVMILNADEQVEVRPVDILRAVGNQWLVNDGLRAGDRVIVDGLQKVRPGDRANAVLKTAGSPNGAASTN